MGVTGIPPEVKLQAKLHVETELEQRSERAISRGRRNVFDEMMIVNSSVEI
jgi:hypothetical protein